MLSDGEHRVLFQYCWDHPVARCMTRLVEYKMSELGRDLFGPRACLCRDCEISLEDLIRSHLATCTVLRVRSSEAQERAQVTRQNSQPPQKESREARDRSEVLSAETE